MSLTFYFFSLYVRKRVVEPPFLFFVRPSPCHCPPPFFFLCLSLFAVLPILLLPQTNHKFVGRLTRSGEGFDKGLLFLFFAENNNLKMYFLDLLGFHSPFSVIAAPGEFSSFQLSLEGGRLYFYIFFIAFYFRGSVREGLSSGNRPFSSIISSSINRPLRVPEESQLNLTQLGGNEMSSICKVVLLHLSIPSLHSLATCSLAMLFFLQEGAEGGHRPAAAAGDHQ